MKYKISFEFENVDENLFTSDREIKKMSFVIKYNEENEIKINLKELLCVECIKDKPKQDETEEPEIVLVIV